MASSQGNSYGFTPSGTPQQQYQQVQNELGRIRGNTGLNPAPGSPTYDYVNYLNNLSQSIYSQLNPSNSGPANGGGGGGDGSGYNMFTAGSPVAMSDSNRNLFDLAGNSQRLVLSPMSGLGDAQRQAVNINRGLTPSGDRIEPTLVDAPVQKSLYSFIPDGQSGNNTGLDPNYLKFLQRVVAGNRGVSAPGG